MKVKVSESIRLYENKNPAGDVIGLLFSGLRETYEDGTVKEDQSWHCLKGDWSNLQPAALSRS